MPARSIAAEKRQHIVETAYRLFARDGFHATGIDRIIAEAAVAKMTMYRHFPSKDGLIVAVLDWRSARFDALLDRLAAEAATPQEQVDAILDWHQRWFDGPDFHGCLFQHALAEFGDPAHPVYAAVTRQKLGLQRRLAGIIESVLPADRARHAAIALSTLIEGATFLAQFGQGGAALDGARAVAAELLADGTPPEAKA